MPPTDRPGISRCNCPPASATASAIISAWCRATIRRWWIRWRAASASCRPIRSGCRSPKAAARNCRSAMPYRSGGCLTEFVELQQVATRKQIQIMSEHTRCPMTKPKLLAYVGDDAAATERYRAEILGKRKSVFDLLEEHPACELPFHAYLEMLSLLAPRYYSISSSPSGDAVALQRHRRRGRGAASSGRGIYKGVCSNYLAGRRAGETIHATVRETKAGFRLPDDAIGADHHDRPRHGARAVPRLPAGARRAEGQGRDARPGDAVFRLPSSRAGFSLRRRAEGVSPPTASPNCTPRSRAARVRRPMCRIWSRRRRIASGA